METFTGTYTTKRDSGIEYSYEAEFTVTSSGATWSATVRQAGAKVGELKHFFIGQNHDHFETLVRTLVEEAIEKNIGVR